MRYFDIVPFHTTLLKPVQREVFANRHLIRRSIRNNFMGSPHREASDCLLRVPEGFPHRPLVDLHKELTCYWDMDMTENLPLTTQLVEDIAEYLGCRELGRVMLTALGTRKHIYPHVDEGPVPYHYERWHFVISSGEHCNMLCGNETLRMSPGMLFWMDVHQTHSAVNYGLQERINLIMDIKP